MAASTILITDDDFQIRMLLRDRLEAGKYQVQLAENGKEALKILEKASVDLLLLDLQMPEMGGMTVLKRMRDRSMEIPVIILTAHGSVEQAVEAMKLGAFDFLPKPCKPDHLMIAVQKALEKKGLLEENRFLRESLDSQYHMIVGESTAMKQVMDIAGQIAGSRTTLLIGGESGTGKQLLAHAVHQMSDRKNRPFIQVNCTTLSEQLMESDLFGHEKGAFTGAVAQKKGRFEMADTGTVFLDEIGDLSPAIQAKLLHVIEYGEFQRVGGVDTMKTDVRLICATHKDLQQEVREGRFREDLFYRINVVSVVLPPLRERPGDVPVLVNYFIEKHGRAMQKDKLSVSEETMDALKKYHWPGNIRELGNVIERAVALSKNSDITPDLLPPLTGGASFQEVETGLPWETAILRFKQNYLRKVLEQMDHNQTQAAKRLRIQRTYLNRLIKELEI
ncbi:sigma-54-dependent Fis family transcriptional regulator [bacterium]|nr:sigma-54-dependent Fis family transcriptional regulator [bacterium]